MTRRWLWSSLALVLGAVALVQARQTDGSRAYLTWSESAAKAIGERAYQSGRVGGFFDFRVLKTERSYNYKLAATLLSRQTIRATARLLQLQSRLRDDAAAALVTEAESVDGLVVMVEIDPREGSGVIPLEWEAFLQLPDAESEAVAGVKMPELRDRKALAGTRRRNYDYDRFWVVFPARDAAAMAAEGKGLELVVRIYNHEGRVTWPAGAVQ
ncbi:MAG: hypothetical protein IT178_12765 [Acidobacteria bacterium]|nr:hypothetical protein [Acidobacteriota bacterium]